MNLLICYKKFEKNVEQLLLVNSERPADWYVRVRNRSWPRLSPREGPSSGTFNGLSASRQSRR